MPVTRKKVFESAAKIIRRQVEESHVGSENEVLRQITLDFALYFATDNPNFDTERFVESCGFGKEDCRSIAWAIREATDSGRK